MKCLRSISVVVLFAAVFVCWAAGAEPAPSRVVRIQSGLVRGAVRDGLMTFKGIPYAQPPVGNLRWQPPQPAKAWKGIRSATTFGHDCMQLPFPGDAAPLGTSPSEDCLYLNVWARQRASAPLPVMVWIYGGGFVNGGSSAAVARQT